MKYSLGLILVAFLGFAKTKSSAINVHTCTLYLPDNLHCNVTGGMTYEPDRLLEGVRSMDLYVSPQQGRLSASVKTSNLMPNLNLITIH